MMYRMKKPFLFILMVLMLAFPFNNLAAASTAAHFQGNTEYSNSISDTEEVSLITNLEDNLVTKADKLTFDLWATNAQGEKISASDVAVTSNGNVVPINWDDTEKTSYTLNLDVGNNHVVIVVNYGDQEYSLEYNITREFAEDGDVIGTYVFSLDAFTIGLGYIIEPIEVDIIKGRNAAYELDAVLTEYGFDYDHTGTLDSNFYLSYLLDDTNEIYKTDPQIPDVLKEALEGNYEEDRYWDGELGEFDFNSLSGWMYSVNNVFPNVGFADYYLSDGDVMRTQFTLALGADIGGGYGNNFFDLVNKDELTRKIAEINSSDLREEYLSYAVNEDTYAHGIDVLETLDSSQAEIDEALNQIAPIDVFEADYQKAMVVETEIANLPDVEELELTDSDLIQSVRKLVDKLTASQKELVSNLNELELLETRLQELENENEVVIGTYVFSLEAFPIGLGHLIEPIEVDIIEGQNAAEHLLRVIEEYGYEARYTGTPKSTFYLSALLDGSNEIYKNDPVISDTLKMHMPGMVNEENYSEGILQEFDFSFLSGWKYSVNNDFPGYGFSEYYLSDGDVMRTQFTLALGDDIGGGYNNFFGSFNKDDLTKRIAEINSSDLKEEYLSHQDYQENYTHGLEVLQTIDTSQDYIDEAFERIVPIDLFESDKQTASEVEKLIDDLPKVDEVELVDSEQISSVREAYDALTESQQSHVSNVEKLELAESRLAELEKEEADKQAASEVEKLINSLPELDAIELSDSEQIEFARSAYEALTESQQSYVTNLEKLETLESRLAELEEEAADKEAASVVEKQINNLPEVEEVALTDREQIESSRSAYDALTETQQSYVTNLDKLEALEIRLAELEQEAADKEAAFEVEELINSLPEVDELALTDRDQVESARSAYDALTEIQQSYVTNVEKLTALENRLVELEQEAADKEAASEVDELITALPEVDELALTDRDEVESARSAYDALTEIQQSYVTNVEKLTTLENRLIELEQEAADREAASEVEQMISNLPKVEEVELTDREQIASVRSAYEALSEVQQSYVTNLEKLVALENRLVELEQEAADKEAASEVDELITALPEVDELTLTDRDQVESARSAYDALTETQKSYVSNIKKLAALENRLVELEQDASDQAAAADVEELIRNLPEIEEIQLSDSEQIIAARTAYSALTDAQKAYVTNLEKLESAESKLAALKDDQAAALEVKEQIDALPSTEALQLADKALVESARAAYNALSDAQKELVSNVAKLEALEAKIVDLVEEAKDLEAAKEVEQLIDALPSTAELKLSDRTQIESARAAYDALTDAQKSLVSNLADLQAVEEQLKKLEEQFVKDQEEARKVEEMITNLPELSELELTDKEQVEEARAAFESLTPAQKEFVTNLSLLEALEAKLVKLEEKETEDHLAAEEVESFIDHLPDLEDLTLEDRELVEAARLAYENLTDDQKERITNLEKLEQAEEKLAELMKERKDPKEENKEDNNEDKNKDEDGEDGNKDGNNKDEVTPPNNKDNNNAGDNTNRDTIDRNTGTPSDGKAGNKLPATATDMYNYLIAGALLILIGAALFFIRRRKAA